MFVTISEFEENLEEYLLLAATEDVLITKNGTAVAKLTSPCRYRLETVDSLFGSLPDTISPEGAREERLDKI